MTLGSKNKSLLKHLSLSSSSSFAIRWIQLVVTTLVVSAALTNLTYGFKSNTEGRKLFGGYRITPKQCRATKTLPSSDPRAKGPTICMFNHECAQRNGEVVGACMDGFLFGACCQVPNDQKPENTLINDAQNAYYHMYQNQKLQQQEAETNKIISQAYESFAENSALQQSFESNQTEDSPYGGSINSNYNVNSIDSHQQDATEQVNTSTQGTTGNTPSSVSVADKTPNTQTSNDIQTKPLQGASNIKIHDNSIKMSSTSQSPQNDDFVLHVLNTLPPGDSNHHVTYATEIPNKISDSLTGQISSESNSFEEELPIAANKPSVVNSQPPNHEDSIKPQHTETYENQNKQTIQQHHVSESVHQDEQQLFGSVTFTHSDITHPGADADLIDDLQFSTGYGPQPLFVSAPPKPIQSYNPDSNKQTSNKYEDTTSSSPITTHVDSIETIIQQLNNNNSNPGPAYNIINHHEQQQEQYQTSTYNTDSVVVTKKPSITSHDEQDNTKHTTSASLSNNGMKLNDKQSISNNYGQISFTSSTSSNLSSAPAFESTTVNTLKDPNKYVLQDHTMPETNYDDYHTSKHPTSNFNKMPANSISYPIDMSYIQGGANLETEDQTHHQQENIHLSHLNSQTTATTQSDEQSNHQYNQSSYSGIEASHTNTEQHQKYQQQQQEHINQVSYASQNDKEKITEAQTIQNYITETHQRPIASYIGVVTSQNYNNQPVPNEVVVSSYTTKVDENSEISTEYKPIITTNEITTTSHKTTAKPEKTTSYIKRPTLVTKRPNNQKPTRTNNHRPTTFGYSSTNNTTTQQHYSTTPIETKTPSPAELSSEKPTISYRPASTSYITEPTTPRPTVTLQFHHGQEVSVIQADDKLDAFVHSTAENLASDTPSQDTLSFDPPVFISGGVQVHNQKPQYNMHKKPTFVRIQTTQTPPAPTLIITPKPTTLQTTASTFTTSFSDYGSTVFVYNSFVTRRPALAENTAADYMGISTVDSNDFDDPGYYGTADHNKLGKPTYVSDSMGSIYPVPTDDKPAFPGYYGPTPIYPVFQIPGEKLDSPNDEQIYTSPNDFINFPPVRNPNLNMSATSSAVTSDLELSTPAFVEDSVLKNKMNTLVHKIVESLQGNFEALSNMIDESNYTAAAQTYQASPSTSTATKKPTRKPATKLSTAKPNATTRKPITKVSTKPPNKKPPTTKKPEATTKRTATRRTTTTTKRPATRKPTRKTTTTTKAPAEDDLVDEEDEEDVNPTNNEIIEEETQNTGESGRKIQCGMRPHVKSGRIVGGKGATFGAYPWQVLVRESTWLGLFTKNKCGGVLITNRYVITAAHCQPGFLASLVAVMGEFDISGDLESKRAVTKNVKRVIVHRQYDPATFENDIALLELESPVQFDTHIVPICMPSDVADFTGRMATVTGWGRLKYGGGVPSVLQEVQVPVIENSVCQEMFHTAGHNKKILKSFLCAGYANGQKDSCEGDSGGPLVLQRADGRYELAGTVSHGIKCASPYLPGVYMRTTYYKPWLRSITGVK